MINIFYVIVINISFVKLISEIKFYLLNHNDIHWFIHWVLTQYWAFFLFFSIKMVSAFHWIVRMCRVVYWAITYIISFDPFDIYIQEVTSIKINAAIAAKSLRSCLTLWPHRRQPSRLLCPWDSPGKNTGVGCHFPLQKIND